MGALAEVKQIVIGIQARSSSERFPRKVFEIIEGKPMLQHVIDSAYSSMNYLNRWAQKNRMLVSVVVLIPTDDEIQSVFRTKVNLFYGPEKDVLKRYHLMAEAYNADIVVRLTGDCPLIPGNLISKHIQCAQKDEYDYFSNVDPSYRTAPDGMDCEVLSRRALDWLNLNAVTASDREHVTPLIRSNPPEWAKVGHMVGFLNLSDIKLSVDTPEELELVKYEFHRVKRILEAVEKVRGKKSVHRF